MNKRQLYDGKKIEALRSGDINRNVPKRVLAQGKAGECACYVYNDLVPCMVDDINFISNVIYFCRYREKFVNKRTV